MDLKQSLSEGDRCDTMETDYLLNKIRLKYYDQKSIFASSKLSTLKQSEIVHKTQVKQRYYLK